MGRTSKRAKELQKQYLQNQEKKEIEENHPWDNCSLKERQMHQSWCFNNEIYIYFEQIDWRKGRIVVIDEGEYILLPEIYNQVKLKPKDVRYWNVIWKLYSKYYYERNKTTIN